MSRHAEIELKDIVKTYHMGAETLTTLKKVSLRVYRGEFMAICRTLRLRQIDFDEYHRLPRYPFRRPIYY